MWAVVAASDLIVQCAFVFIDLIMLCFHQCFIHIVRVAGVKGSFEFPSLPMERKDISQL